jgi:acetyltransferase-like isoleucine patch superfamily enzyme
MCGLVLTKTEKGEAERLLALHSTLRKDVKKKWDRILPMDELLFDRWEKARYSGFGEGTSIYHNSYVYGDVTVGKSTWIGPFTILDGSGARLTIGDFCSISSGVQIYTHNTVRWALSGGKAKYEKGATSIGNNCYLGPYAIVTMGANIAENCLIGAHALVNKPIPKNSIVFGIPGKVVGKVKTRGDSVQFVYDR